MSAYQRFAGAGVWEWTPVGVLMNLRNRSGAGIIFWGTYSSQFEVQAGVGVENLKSCGVGADCSKAGVESESKSLDFVRHCRLLCAVGHAATSKVNTALVAGRSPLHPCINAEHEAEQDASTVFEVFGMTQPGIELILLALVSRAQPSVPAKS